MINAIAPEPPTPERLEAGRKLFAGQCDFVLGAARLDQIPASDLVEVCFAGRSNVGKSSLINALLNRKDLARTSNTPGRTQQLNFFDLGGRVMICDLPGYGYARAPKGTVDAWTRLVTAYLKGRVELRRTLVLIDSRHGIKNTDRPIFDMLDKAAQPYQVILTKVDKIKQAALEKTLAETQAELAKHPAAHPLVIPTSSEKGQGLAELRAEITGLLD